jgi:hypothetical protein
MTALTEPIMQWRGTIWRAASKLQIGTDIARLGDAAQRLVRTPFARRRIPLIAEALLRRGTLVGDEIGGMIAAHA